MVECLRIRPNIPKREKEKIAGDRLTAALASIKAGSFTLQKLRAKFALTDDQEIIIADFEKEAA